MTRPVLFISWSVRHGRSRDLAAALGADGVYVGIRRRRRRWLAPFRYVASSVVTVVTLLRRRPRAVFVMAPPLPLTVIALLYGRLARAPVAIDAHTGAVFAIRTAQLCRGMQRAGRRATAVIVTNSVAAAPLRTHGATTVVLHDAVPDVDNSSQPASPFAVVAPLSWAPDEPFEVIIAAARLCPDVRFVATGRPPESVSSAGDLPANLELTGFLAGDAFDHLMATAGVVLALTTREATMQRAGYEAMALGVPVIASATSVLREFFAASALYASSAPELAAAVTEVRLRRPEFAAAIVARRDVVQRDFAAGLAELKALMGLGAP